LLRNCLSAFGCLKVVYNDSQAKLATKYDSRQCRYEIGFRFSSFVFRHSRESGRTRGRKNDDDHDDDHDLFVHRDTETQSFVLLKTFVSLNKSLTFDHLRASSYGTHLIAILCSVKSPSLQGRVRVRLLSSSRWNRSNLLKRLQKLSLFEHFGLII